MLGRKFAYCNAGCKFIQWVYESFLKREKVGLRCDEVIYLIYQFIYILTIGDALLIYSLLLWLLLL